MVIIRPVEQRDIEGVYQLAGKAPNGLTTLPYDLEKIEAKVMESVKNVCFPPSCPGGESFLFVLEDVSSGKVVGTSAVFTKVGGFHPFWTYQVKTKTIESEQLGIRKDVKYLELKAENNGPTEIGTLFLDADFRENSNGRFLSLSRFLFIAEFRSIFEDSVLAELRGTIDKHGNAVFWNNIGAHFFGIPFDKADTLVNEDKSFIEDLMPKFPIYVDLLTKEAQLVMGVVAEETRPALRLLEMEGFQRISEIDIFEAGPIVECVTDKIRTVAQSRKVTYLGSCEINNADRRYMVANVNSLQSYKVAVSRLVQSDQGIKMPISVAEALGLDVGDEVRFSPLRNSIGY